MTVNLDETEISTATNALRIAVERFIEYANMPDMPTRVREQFRRQAEQSRDLADKLDEVE